uniref:Uncharacterized protein n=1 Tax=Parascaris univalens TaxID=6257 RepID=A0A915BZT8_PARUN
EVIWLKGTGSARLKLPIVPVHRLASRSTHELYRCSDFCSHHLVSLVPEECFFLMSSRGVAICFAQLMRVQATVLYLYTAADDLNKMFCLWPLIDLLVIFEQLS